MNTFNNFFATNDLKNTLFIIMLNIDQKDINAQFHRI